MTPPNWNAASSICPCWWNAAGQEGLIPLDLPASAGSTFQTLHFDLTDRANYIVPGAQAVWGGHIVRFELFRGLAAGGGVLVPTEDPAALAEAVAGLLADPARRAAMGNAGRAAAAGFGVERLVQRTLEVYRSLDLHPGG